MHVSSRLWQLAPVRQLRRAPPPAARAAIASPSIAGDCNSGAPVVVAMLPGLAARGAAAAHIPRHDPHSQIDHVLVRDNVSVVWGEVLAATPSDHRPGARSTARGSPRSRTRESRTLSANLTPMPDAAAHADAWPCPTHASFGLAPP